MKKEISNKPRILLFDIENSPTVVTTWGLWEQNAIETIEEWFLMSYSYKWYGEDKVHSVALPDFPGYKKNKHDDRRLCESLHKLFEEADVIVAHNGDTHDQPKSNARFIFHGLLPPSPYKTIDTKKVAKRYFKFNSNSLNNLSKYFGLGEKIENPKGLWRGCMDGDLKSWKLMKKYNKQDVVLLEKIYEKMKPWMGESHPYIGEGCPVCLSKNIQKRGFTRYKNNKAKQRFQCQDCGAWYQGKLIKKDECNRL